MNTTITVKVGTEQAAWHFGQTIVGDIEKLMADQNEHYLSLMAEWDELPRCEFSFGIADNKGSIGVGGISYARESK